MVVDLLGKPPTAMTAERLRATAAARQNYPNAEDSLGLGYMYEHGRGVAMNLDIAGTSYRKGADQGFAKTKINPQRLSQQ